jgi:hypothetical protein
MRRGCRLVLKRVTWCGGGDRSTSVALSGPGNFGRRPGPRTFYVRSHSRLLRVLHPPWPLNSYFRHKPNLWPYAVTKSVHPWGVPKMLQARPVRHPKKGEKFRFRRLVLGVESTKKPVVALFGAELLTKLPRRPLLGN